MKAGQGKHFFCVMKTGGEIGGGPVDRPEGDGPAAHPAITEFEMLPGAEKTIF